MPDRVLVFARAPIPGRVKTRLEPLVGKDGAAAVHEALVGDVIAAVLRRPATEVVLYHDSAEPGEALRSLGVALRPQCAGDLGVRMEEALREQERSGAGRVVILGLDSPDVPPATLDRAFAALGRAPVVIGPAVDGGYWLLGARGVPEPISGGIPWGTSGVLGATLRALRARPLAAELLDPWYDVDRPEDLRFLHAHLRLLLELRGEDRCPRSRAVLDRLLGDPGVISVVVPCLDEERTLGLTLEALAAERAPHEVVVVDGGSRDRTRAVAAARGARVLVAGRGRARQMAAGARAAKGDVLVFLHADTRLGRGHLEAALRALDNPAVGFGSFAIELDREGPALRLIAAAANLRTRIDRTPYGDQAVFVRRAAYERAGGFADVPLLEDVLLARALRRAGFGFRFLRAPRVVTSARRWEADGAVARTLRNWATRGLFELGVSPQRLESFYHGGRAGRTPRAEEGP